MRQILFWLVAIAVCYPKILKQECIPVGCVPSAAVAVCWGGGVSAQWGVCLEGGVCPGGCLPRGVSVRGCMPRAGGVSTWGVSAQVGCLLWGEVCPGGCLPRGMFAQVGVFSGRCIPRGGGVCLRGVYPGGCLPKVGVPTVNRITDACENRTLPQLCCGR